MMSKEIKEHIESLGIRPEDEHYEIAELIIQECAEIVRNLMPESEFVETAIKEHFGLKY